MVLNREVHQADEGSVHANKHSPQVSSWLQTAYIWAQNVLSTLVGEGKEAHKLHQAQNIAPFTHLCLSHLTQASSRWPLLNLIYRLFYSYFLLLTF